MTSSTTSRVIAPKRIAARAPPVTQTMVPRAAKLSSDAAFSFDVHVACDGPLLKLAVTPSQALADDLGNRIQEKRHDKQDNRAEKQRAI